MTVKNDTSFSFTDTCPVLNYFDQMRQKYRLEPFEDKRAEVNFKVSLENWGSSCDASHLTRRQFYRVENYYTLDQVAQEAPFKMKLTSEDGKRSIDVYLVREPINRFEADAVINAANETLLGGGGADQEIHEGAGPNLVKECAYHNGCEVGEAVITKGYDLPAKYVLHTVGPLLLEDGQGDKPALASCYKNCLNLCDRYKLESVVAPCVACGFYAFPLNDAAAVVKRTLKEYLVNGGSTVKTVILSVPKDKEWAAYQKIFQS
jgi:O-acetyl-ADP-ribose deacetylase (regulator of RNase III)